MGRLLYIGNCYYTYLGIKNVLREITGGIDVVHFSLGLHVHSEIKIGKSDIILINPTGNDFFRYASLIRDKNGCNGFHQQRITIISDKYIYQRFEMMCGVALPFIASNGDLFTMQQDIIDVLRGEFATEFDPPKIKVTKTEFEIMMLIINGWKLSQIAYTLQKNIKTVSTHKSNLLQKLGLPNNKMSFLMISHEDNFFIKGKCHGLHKL